ncbi:unnamed protein product [Brassicogethes aeneus]|uniref:Major facilitator superfamily (MFS) profile domain-containing protein n=1 Tax=Brassicogethes aeneus TaxID=1431903 RepID=A0A9P0AR20_BRAAE|nr:unnamed protein product [Brassicogethes aeneus]
METDALLDRRTMDNRGDLQALEDNLENNQNPENYKARFQYFAAISATLSAFASGAVLGWTSPILDILENGDFNGIKVDNDQMGWIGSLATLGAVIMCIPMGVICDFMGRKKSLLFLVLPFTVGWALILFSKNILMLYFGRLFCGMAVGGTCVAAPLYTGEIAHKNLRGSLGSYFQLMVTVGILFAYVLGKFLTVKAFTIACACLPFIFVVLFVFQPESPVYLIKLGLYDAAESAMVRLRGTPGVQYELLELEETVKESTNSQVSMCRLLKRKSSLVAIVISFALMFFQQFCGINTIILYVSKIFETSGVKMDSKTASIIVAIVLALSTFIASLVIEKLGRKFLLILSSSVLIISNLTIAVYFTLKDRNHIDEKTLSHFGFIPVSAVCVFVAVFSLGLGPIPWMISSEIFVPEIKSVVSSVAGTLNWFMAFLITKFFLQINQQVGMDSTFYFFSVMSALGAIFIYKVVPETKGKTIMEIQYELDS